MIEDYLTETMTTWEQMKNPSLLERFVLRNGKQYKPRRRIGRRRKANECYGNATNFVLGKEGVYVEGFAIHAKRPIIAFHHAWVTINGDDAMDPTLDARDYEYFGVAFDKETLCDEIINNGVYGLLDPGMGINWRFMFKIDPELREIAERIIGRKLHLEAEA